MTSDNSDKYFVYSREMHDFQNSIAAKLSKTYKTGTVSVKSKNEQYTCILSEDSLDSFRYTDAVVVASGPIDSFSYTDPQFD